MGMAVRGMRVVLDTEGRGGDSGVLSAEDVQV